MKRLFMCCLVLLFILSCEQTTDPNEEVQNIDIRIHVTGFGGSSSGSRWQQGYVENHSGPKVVRVKVQWNTDIDSGSASCSPNVLGKGDKGSYYFSYIGSNLKTSIDYDKE